MVRFSCPKCGGMYMNAGRCETCGYMIDSFQTRQQSASPNEQSILQQDVGPISENRNLMKCPDCGRMISKDALFCPQCGCPFSGNMRAASAPQTNRRQSGGIGVLGIACGVLIGLLVYWYLKAPYSMPVWLQQIFGTIHALFKGETTYKIFDPSGIIK